VRSGLTARFSVAAMILAAFGGCGSGSSNSVSRTPHEAATQRSAAQAPRLGSAASAQTGSATSDLIGFGQARPSTIWLGGDSTTELRNIRWLTWGGTEAVGFGESVWVWPGTCTGCNRLSRARVVAFHLGSCNGQPSYNALEWYFPEYGETFSATKFTNACTQTRVGTVTTSSTPPQCPPSRLAGGGTAIEMTAEHMSCKAASQIIAGLPAGPFAKERRFKIAGFRCGTEGTSFMPNDIVACARLEESIFFTASY
jgi:hypothetical protein